MTNKVEFFRCFSPNLHKFLKATGLRPMSKEVHTGGITVSADGGKTWQSFTGLGVASRELEIDFAELQRIHTMVNASDNVQAEVGGYLFAKRVRNFWIYQSSPQLDKSLKTWKDTGPNK